MQSCFPTIIMSPSMYFGNIESPLTFRLKYFIPSSVHFFVHVENALPMHPNCRCSTSAYMDREKFDQWLDAKSKGGFSGSLDGLKTKNVVKDNGIHCFGDRLRDILGPAKVNNVEELQRIEKDVINKGGQIIFLKNSEKMVTNVSKGKPGVIEVDENISIAALKHEYRHFLDDLENGCPGMSYYLKDNDIFYEYERRGYMEELEIAKQTGYNKAIKLIEGEIEKRRKEIYGIE